MELKDNFAANLEALRGRWGYSQADMAQEIGISQPHYSRLAAGGTDLRLSSVTKYAIALQQDPLKMLRGKTRRKG